MSIYIIYLFRFYDDELAGLPGRDQGGGKIPLLINGGVGLSDGILLLIEGEEVFNGIGNPTVFYFAARRFDKTVLINTRVGA